MKRAIEKAILKDLGKKIIMVSGPRQVGKTTLSKSLVKDCSYFNFDVLEHRKQMLNQQFPIEKHLLIFDEIHKMQKWKLWLKGIYDQGYYKKIMVTGSARLDTFKRTGDSLAGRYFSFHLFPLDLKELSDLKEGRLDENFEKLFSLSGFPEPFLNGDEVFYKRWRKSHLETIVREDIGSLEALKRLNDLLFLVELLQDRVGSPLSYNSLREDLSTDDKTIKRWVLALEQMYVLFKITPYSKSIKKSITKSAKIYFFDYPRIEIEKGRLENFVALALYKECVYRNDLLGEDYKLHYLQKRDGREIDFIIIKGKIPVAMIEVKTNEDQPSKNFEVFASDIIKSNAKLRKIQLVLNLKRSFINSQGVEVLPLKEWLTILDF